MVLTPRTCWADPTTARAVGLAEALIAETKVLRAGALSCFANGERRALENVRDAIFLLIEWRDVGCEGEGKKEFWMFMTLGPMNFLDRFLVPRLRYR